MTCTRCDATGFLNIGQVPDEVIQRAEDGDFCAVILAWMATDEGKASDVAVCDCCGDGEDWHCNPGEHDSCQFGPNGPYAYNGGLPECN